MSTTIKPIILKDRQLDLFEGQYPIPDGITYNSYIIEDEKMRQSFSDNAFLDIDKFKKEKILCEWTELTESLSEKK